eukprot:m.645898 g.645898  ORF g.645898 m.645898 type:complete len:123 (+) comp22651_c0_seq38:2181-2549(+)
MDNRSAADAQFDIAFSHMDLSHFNVWREKNFSDGGHKNFITGAGGYVQNYIFGYAGLRYNRAPAAVGMTIHPYLPPHNVTSLKLRGIAVAAARVSVSCCVWHDFRFCKTCVCVNVCTRVWDS